MNEKLYKNAAGCVVGALLCDCTVSGAPALLATAPLVGANFDSASKAKAM